MADPYRPGMTSTLDPNSSSSSTTWAWRLVKISAVAPAGVSANAESSSSRGRRKRDMREPLTIQVRYNGGPESSWVIWARGMCRRFPGHMRLDDVFQDLSAPRLGLGRPSSER